MTLKPKSPSEQARSWRDVLPIHPAAELFPRMTPKELRELGEDIIKNGLTAPIALWRPDPESPLSLLDGISRLDAIESTTGQPVLVRVPSLTAGNFLAAYKVVVLDKSVDPYAYVISANIHRRHLTTKDKRDAIAKVIKAMPEKSDRQIGEMIKADHKTVGAIRAEREATGEISPVAKRIGKDRKPRKQPVRKPTRSQSPSHAGKVDSFAAISRRVKLENELPKIRNTSLDTPAEMDALAELKQIDQRLATALVDRAAQGEAVSAAVEIDKRKFKPRPDAAALMEAFDRHSHALQRLWARATPAECRQWIKNLEGRVDLLDGIGQEKPAPDRADGLDIPAFLRREAVA